MPIQASRSIISLLAMGYGPWLKEVRTAKNVSQLRLAELMTAHGYTVSNGAISNIEREYYKKDEDTGKPKRKFVIAAAEVLGEDVNKALKIAGYDAEDDDGWFKGLEGLSPEKKKLAKRQIRAIIDALAEEPEPDIDYADDEPLT